MGYSATINSQLNKAFNLAKDLAVDVVLTKKPNPTFDFATGQAGFSGSQTVTTKAIFADIKTDAREQSNTVRKQVMLKLEESGQIDSYSSLTYNSEVWSFGTIIKSDGFVQLAEVMKNG